MFYKTQNKKKKYIYQISIKMMDEDIDPFTLENIKPEEKIIINKQIYNIKSIYRWIIYMKNVKDPLRNDVTDDDRQ